MNKKKKIIVSAITLVFLFTIIFSLPILQKPARAQAEDIIGEGVSTIGNAVALILSWILWVPMMAIAQFSLVIIHLLVQASQFDNFINVSAVGIGWQTMRDFCNMFFIIILLLIAFGTVLGIETWNYRRLLGRLIVAAVLINFSKMICGVLIDFSQIIMGTFVNAFKDTAAAILVNATGWDKMISMQNAMGKDITNMSLGGTMILNMFFILISFIVILAIFLILVVRIVMLWFLIIFSPIIWIGGLVPAMSGYISKWWTQFTQWVIVGPILVFLLWFSLLMFQAGDVAKQAGGEAIAKATKDGAITASLNDLSNSENTLNYAFSIAMLLMSLVFAQQLAGKAGSAIVGWSKKAGRGITKAGLGAELFATGYPIWKTPVRSNIKAAKEMVSITPYARVLTADGRTAMKKESEENARIRFGLPGAYERSITRKGKEYEEQGLFRNSDEMKDKYKEAVKNRDWAEAEVYGRQLAKQKALGNDDLKLLTTSKAGKDYQEAARVMDKLSELGGDYNKSMGVSFVEFKNGKYVEETPEDKKVRMEKEYTKLEDNAGRIKVGDIGSAIKNMNDAGKFEEQAHFYLGLGNDQINNNNLPAKTKEKIIEQLNNIAAGTNVDFNKRANKKLRDLNKAGGETETSSISRPQQFLQRKGWEAYYKMAKKAKDPEQYLKGQLDEVSGMLELFEKQKDGNPEIIKFLRETEEDIKGAKRSFKR